jgi:hypothetical protein
MCTGTTHIYACGHSSVRVRPCSLSLATPNNPTCANPYRLTEFFLHRSLPGAYCGRPLCPPDPAPAAPRRDEDGDNGGKTGREAGKCVKFGCDGYRECRCGGKKKE